MIYITVVFPPFSPVDSNGEDVGNREKQGGEGRSRKQLFFPLICLFFGRRKEGKLIERLLYLIFSFWEACMR